MTLVGRLVGLFVLCVLVGLFLESIGITARGFLTDTWHTLGSLFHKTRDLVAWSLPYALLGAIIVVPLALLSLLGRLRRRRR
jgi:Na+/H+-dicarboxylate symporter